MERSHIFIIIGAVIGNLLFQVLAIAAFELRDKISEIWNDRKWRE